MVANLSELPEGLMKFVGELQCFLSGARLQRKSSLVEPISLMIQKYGTLQNFLSCMMGWYFAGTALNVVCHIITRSCINTLLRVPKDYSKVDFP
jgi:hypothetical protein